MADDHVKVKVDVDVRVVVDARVENVVSDLL